MKKYIMADNFNAIAITIVAIITLLMCSSCSTQQALCPAYDSHLVTYKSNK